MEYSSCWALEHFVHVGHVNYMLFVSFLFAVCSQHEHDFWWNIGLTVYNLLGLLLCEHFPIRNHTLPATCVSFAPVITVMRDFSHSETRGLVNNYGERGQQNVKNYRPQTFCTLPQDRVNFHPPPHIFKGGNLSCIPPNFRHRC